MQARRKIAPFPLEILIDNPDAMALNAAPFGAVVRLVAHFWLTDCRPLPTTDRLLFGLARAHKATWLASRAEINSILADVLPKLIAAREYSNMQRAKLNEARTRMMVGHRVRKLAKAHAAPEQLLPDFGSRRSERTRQARVIPPTSTKVTGGWTEA